MYVYRRTVGQGETHAAENSRFRAEGLAVHKVAPAADGLSDEQPHHAAVGHRPELDLLDAAKDECRQKAHDDCAVDGKPAVAYGEYLAGICREVIPFKQHIVKP